MLPRVSLSLHRMIPRIVAGSLFCDCQQQQALGGALGFLDRYPGSFALTSGAAAFNSGLEHHQGAADIGESHNEGVQKSKQQLSARAVVCVCVCTRMWGTMQGDLASSRR